MKSRRPKNGAKTPRRLYIDELLAQRSTLLRGVEELRALRSAEVDATKGDAHRFLSEVCRLKLF